MGDKPDMEQGLRETVEEGGYTIDPQAVAAAMLARDTIRAATLGMLVAPQAVHRRAIRVPEDEASALGDAA